jgi:hypothetical protein
MNGPIPICGGRSVTGRVLFAALTVLILGSTTALAVDLVPAHAPGPQLGGGLQVALSVPDGNVQTGDRRTITASVTNTNDIPVDGVTLLLGLVDLTPGQPVPLGLETWTTDAESVALPPIAPGASASAVWHLVMIQPGPLGVYASALAGPAGPIESSAVSVLPVRDVRALNPGNVLPVAIGEPLVLLGLLGGLRCWGGRREW